MEPAHAVRELQGRRAGGAAFGVAGLRTDRAGPGNGQGTGRAASVHDDSRRRRASCERTRRGDRGLPRRHERPAGKLVWQPDRGGIDPARRQECVPVNQIGKRRFRRVVPAEQLTREHRVPQTGIGLPDRERADGGVVLPTTGRPGSHRGISIVGCDSTTIEAIGRGAMLRPVISAERAA